MDRRRSVATFAALFLITGLGCRSLPYNPNPSCGPCDRYLGPATAACPVELPGVVPPGTARFENLVFEGGGVKGAAYAGALKVLERDGLVAPVQRVAGTSAGSILALLLALGYTPDEIMEVLLSIDFERFRDGRPLKDVERLFSQFGWYKGDFALCLFECVVEKKTGSRQTTFAQLRERMAAQPERGFRDMRVFGANVNTHRFVEFSADNPETREVPLAQAVRISMSIPYFFAARRLDGDVYVDGGALINYPIGAFDRGSPKQATLGLHLGTQPTRRGEVRGLVSFTEELFNTLMDTQVDTLCATPEDVRRSVFIDPLGISATDFGLTLEQKCALVRSGIQATDAYLRESVHPDTCPLFLTKLRPAAR